VRIIFNEFISLTLVWLLEIVWTILTYTFIHESGHIIAICVSSMILKIDTLCLRFCPFGGNGRTESELYAYLSDNRYDKKCQLFIQFNAIFGVFTEFIVYIIFSIYSILQMKSYNMINFYLFLSNFVRAVMALYKIVEVIIYKFTKNYPKDAKSTDSKYFLHPEEFEFIPNPNLKFISKDIIIISFKQPLIYICNTLCLVISIILYLLL